METAHRVAKHWGVLTFGGYLFERAASGTQHLLGQVLREGPEIVLARAHACDNSAQLSPLIAALHHGFASLEADVWLVGGELLVAHALSQVHAERTLAALLLEPLRERVLANDGLVYEGFPHSLQLLIDMKSEAEPTYRVLHAQLARYSQMLTVFSPAGVRERAITVVVSGNRARALMASQPVRFAGCEGPGGDLDAERCAAFMPLISHSWSDRFRWQGVGRMPSAERDALRVLVETAHARGQRVRFRATEQDPCAREAVWLELLDAGVDYIHTDDLAGLASWLVRHDPWPSTPEIDWFGAAQRCRYQRRSIAAVSSR